jgi:hypothetical protein
MTPEEIRKVMTNDTQWAAFSNPDIDGPIPPPREMCLFEIAAQLAELNLNFRRAFNLNVLSACPFLKVDPMIKRGPAGGLLVELEKVSEVRSQESEVSHREWNDILALRIERLMGAVREEEQWINQSPSDENLNRRRIATKTLEHAYSQLFSWVSKK